MAYRLDPQNGNSSTICIGSEIRQGLVARRLTFGVSDDETDATRHLPQDSHILEVPRIGQRSISPPRRAPKKANTPRRLNARQQRFVEEYLIDLNATAAYRRAGYRSRGAAARAGAGQLLENTSIAAAIVEAKAERSARMQVTLDDVIQQLARIGFADIADFVRCDSDGKMAYLPLSEINRDSIAAIRQACPMYGKGGQPDGVKYRFYNRVAALSLLLRHLTPGRSRRPSRRRSSR